jgi:transcriptional regulator with PAS, ATPase and Fis domain
MESQIQFINTSPEDASKPTVEAIKKLLEDFKKDILAKNANDELLSREQACEFLQINASTLWAWENRGKVKSYGISGNRRYYKRSELMQALKPINK